MLRSASLAAPDLLTLVVVVIVAVLRVVEATVAAWEAGVVASQGLTPVTGLKVGVAAWADVVRVEEPTLVVVEGVALPSPKFSRDQEHLTILNNFHYNSTQHSLKAYPISLFCFSFLSPLR